MPHKDVHPPIAAPPAGHRVPASRRFGPVPGPVQRAVGTGHSFARVAVSATGAGGSTAAGVIQRTGKEKKGLLGGPSRGYGTFGHSTPPAPSPTSSVVSSTPSSGSSVGSSVSPETSVSSPSASSLRYVAGGSPVPAPVAPPLRYTNEARTTYGTFGPASQRAPDPSSTTYQGRPRTPEVRSIASSSNRDDVSEPSEDFTAEDRILAARETASKASEYMSLVDGPELAFSDELTRLTQDSPALRDHKRRQQRKEGASGVAGTVVDKATGLPVSSTVSTLKSAKEAVTSAVSSSSGGNLADPEIQAAKESQASLRFKQAASTGIKTAAKVGGAVVGGLAGTAVAPGVGTVAGGAAGGMAAGKAAEKAVGAATGMEEHRAETRRHADRLHARAQQGDGEALATLRELGIDEELAKAPDGWKAIHKAMLGD